MIINLFKSNWNREEKTARKTLLIEIILLGIIQGITEWLPISSTGHLKVAKHLLRMIIPEDALFLEFALHIGTLAVVLIYLKDDVKKILSALTKRDFKTEHGKLVPLIVAGTIPAAVIGLLLKESVEKIFQNLLPIAIAFIACGILLYASKIGKEKTDLSLLTAVIVGIAEGTAIIPGISRSGITMATAILLGTKRENAFKFSLLLSIPATIGAIGYTLKDYDALASSGLSWINIVAGVAIAMAVGYFALKMLWKIMAKKKFHLFAFYCWLFGIALIVIGLSGF